MIKPMPIKEDPVWNKGTPMPISYTCGCGLYVHTTVRNVKAIHCDDCPYKGVR